MQIMSDGGNTHTSLTMLHHLKSPNTVHSRCTGCRHIERWGLTAALTIKHMILYFRIAATEVVGLAGVTEVVGLAGVTEAVGLAGVTEVVGLAGVTEVVGLAGSPPAEDGCVQMLSSVTEDKLSEASNGINISCWFLVSVNVNLLVPNTSMSLRYIRPVDVMLILRYFPRASVVRFITTGVVPSSLTIENIVLSVLVERCPALWTERLRVGILPRALNVIFTLPTRHPRGMSSTTKGLVLPFHTYVPPILSGPDSSVISQVRSPPLTVHRP